ncbi:sensor histidine kinase [Paenibacillus harenae]|uniref:sensor histidine kinase n=1 Tax=Paenibacillus harenae TaxID=306543 RepID=UPI0027938F95|nr:HAMP domain-containing sensor histidine kinase [Paenibacillus harenae]MDQ0061352.1 signal transduction histidine kinase [Paenibacillus harenae]
MKGNIILRLMWRLTWHMALSVFLSLITVAAARIVVEILVSGTVFRSILKDIVYFFGMDLLTYAAGIMFFLIYFLIFQWLQFRYLGRINETVNRIASGQLDFDYQMEVDSRSPFGPMAGNLNRMAGRLDQALLEERRAEQAKNELITNVSHDLRTPLTSILGYLGLIEQDRYRDEVELRHYVQIAYDKSQRLNVLINDLFDYTRMRHDTVAMQHISFNLIEVLGQLLVQYHMPLQEAGMEGRLHTVENSMIVGGDPVMLVRVFENLIANAMAYGKEGKLVELRVQRDESKSQATVEVINYGEPISALDLPHIFERFYRADKSRTEWAGGSGLGLAISKSIVEKHGGHIDAVSDTIRTAFRVTLPILKE